MKDDDNFGATLAAATCALLGTAASTPVAAEEEASRWSLDSTLLYYGESDDRVQDVSAAVAAQRDFGDERKFSATLSFLSKLGAWNTTPNSRRTASVSLTGSRPKIFTLPD